MAPMEGVTEADIAASIIGSAGAGFRLSLVLNAVSCEIPNAPTGLYTISKKVHFFALLLNRVASALGQDDIVHSSRALAFAGRATEESQNVFDTINFMLDRVRSSESDKTNSSTLQQRFNSCFKKHRIAYLLGQLESLEVSLSLMLQILRIGRLLASTSRHDTPQMVKHISAEMRRARVEAQNTTILLHLQNKELQRLRQQAMQEQEELPSPVERRNNVGENLISITANDSQGTLVETGSIVIKGSDDEPRSPAPSHLFDDLEEKWDAMDSSQTEMIQTSYRIVDKLLERWTKWKQKREEGESRRAQSRAAGRYSSSVHDLSEDNDETAYFERYREPDDSPRGYYLEGTTSDWRKPHSAAAKQEAVQRRKDYAAYQPSISPASSEVEDSPSSAGSRKRSTKKYVISSSPETSGSETEQSNRPRRNNRNNAAADHRDDTTIPTPLLISRPSGTTQPNPQTPTMPQQASTPPSFAARNLSSQPNRPRASPDQNVQHHHSLSQPIPPAYNHHAYIPQHTNPPALATFSSSPQSYQQQHLGPPQLRSLAPSALPPGARPQQRPVSREGKPPRSPSRLSHSTSASAVPSTQGARTYSRSQKAEEERRAHRKEVTRNLSEGATKGLLAGGGIAMFLEALDALAI